MSKEIPFLVYCIETYKMAKNINGKEVFDLFEHYKLNDYIIKHFEALHTTSKEYIIADIDEFIAVRK